MSFGRDKDCLCIPIGCNSVFTFVLANGNTETIIVPLKQKYFTSQLLQISKHCTSMECLAFLFYDDSSEISLAVSIVWSIFKGVGLVSCSFWLLSELYTVWLNIHLILFFLGVGWGQQHLHSTLWSNYHRREPENNNAIKLLTQYSTLPKDWTKNNL